MTIPLTPSQKIIRDKEAELVWELMQSGNAQKESAANWFEKRWGVAYSEIIKPVKIPVR